MGRKELRKKGKRSLMAILAAAVIANSAVPYAVLAVEPATEVENANASGEKADVSNAEDKENAEKKTAQQEIALQAEKETETEKQIAVQQAEVPETEKQTEAPQIEKQAEVRETEKQTEVPQTEAPETEKQTEKQTEAPQTEAPETEKQTEAPQTEKQTEAPQTEASETEKQTEAPQTEAPETEVPQTEVPETELQTEPETQTETESESESETEQGLSDELQVLQDRIDALPTVEEFKKMTDGEKVEDSNFTQEQYDVYLEAEAICEEYEKLSEADQALLDITKLEALMKYFTEAMMQSAEDGLTISQSNISEGPWVIDGKGTKEKPYVVTIDGEISAGNISSAPLFEVKGTSYVRFVGKNGAYIYSVDAHHGLLKIEKDSNVVVTNIVVGYRAVLRSGCMIENAGTCILTNMTLSGMGAVIRNSGTVTIDGGKYTATEMTTVFQGGTVIFQSGTVNAYGDFTCGFNVDNLTLYGGTVQGLDRGIAIGENQQLHILGFVNFLNNIADIEMNNTASPIEIGADITGSAKIRVKNAENGKQITAASADAKDPHYQKNWNFQLVNMSGYALDYYTKGRYWYLGKDAGEGVVAHDWKYTASGNTITATCTDAGCPYENGAVLTVNAKDAVYDGQPHPATVTNEISQITGAAVKVWYDGGGVSGLFDYKSEDAPTDAGYYVVSAELTVGEETYTAKEELRISRATPEVTAPAVNKDLTYNGALQPLLTAGSTNVGTMEYSMDGANWSATVPQARDAGSYEAYYRVTIDPESSMEDYNNYHPIAPTQLSENAVIAKKDVMVTAINAKKTYGESDPELMWQATGTVDGDPLSADDIAITRAEGEDVGTYTITPSAKAGANANYEYAFTPAEFTITKAAQQAPVVQTEAESVKGRGDGKITGVTSGMEYREEGGTVYTAVTGDTVVLVPGTYYVRYQEDKNHEASPETEAVIGAGEEAEVVLPTESEQKGYRLTATKQSAAWGEKITLTLTLADGYSKTENFALKVNGTPVTLNEDNTFVLKDLEGDVQITVEGVADITAPRIDGVETDGVYTGSITFTVTEENLKEVTVDGVPVSPENNTSLALYSETANSITSAAGSDRAADGIASIDGEAGINGAGNVAATSTSTQSAVQKTYTFTLIPKNGNYRIEASDESGNVTTAGNITVNWNEIAVPDVGSKEYTGEPLFSDVTGTADYFVAESDGGIHARRIYEVMLILVDPVNNKWVGEEGGKADVITTFVITPKPIAGAEIILGPTLRSNGNEQAQTVEKVLVDGRELSEDDYTVENNTGRDVGTYTLTVRATDDGNYIGEIQKEFEILEAETETETETPAETETETETPAETETESETSTEKQSETKKQTETEKKTPTGTATPRTGDPTNMMGYTVACILSLAAVALLLGGRKKYRR